MNRFLPAASLAALLFAATPALAHVELEKNTAPAGGDFKLVFMVPHGCAGSPTSASAGNGSPGMVLINTSQYDGNIITPVIKPSGMLTADDGRAFNLRADTRGIVTLLYFGYTHCPDVCPTTMADIGLALQKVSPAVRAQARVVFVTTDIADAA